jgi:hypothetical protein
VIIDVKWRCSFFFPSVRPLLFNLATPTFSSNPPEMKPLSEFHYRRFSWKNKSEEKNANNFPPSLSLYHHLSLSPSLSSMSKLSIELKGKVELNDESKL